MTREMDAMELVQLEQRLRNAVVGHRPQAPDELVKFIDTVPILHRSRRPVFGWFGPFDVFGRGSARRGMVGLAVVASIVIGMLGGAGLGFFRQARHDAVQSEGPPTSRPTQAGQPSITPELTNAFPAFSPSPSVSPSASPSASNSAAGGGGVPGGPSPTPKPARTISGRVTDTSGNPLAGISICLTKDGCIPASSDSGGNYTAGVNPGHYTVWLEDPAGIHAGGFLGLSRLTYDVAAARDIDVTTGDANGVDVVMPVAVTVAFHVTDSAGVPLSGIQCWLSDAIKMQSDTDASGNCSFKIAPGDVVDLEVVDPSEAYMWGFYLPSSPTGYAAYEGASSWVTVPATGFSGTLAMPTLHHITGRVTMSSGASLPPDTMIFATCSVAGGVTIYVGSDGTYSIPLVSQTCIVGVGTDGPTGVIGYYSGSGYTTNISAATEIVLGDTDVTGIDIVLPG